MRTKEIITASTIAGMLLVAYSIIFIIEAGRSGM